MKVKLPFQELLTLVKNLTPSQKTRLKKELEITSIQNTPKEDDFIKLLLNGPIYSDKDLAIIEDNRKSITAWRIKK